MIRSVLILAATAALTAAPAFAADAGHTPAKPAPRPVQTAETQPIEAQAQLAPRGPNLRDQCSRENPFIEYRDCVNASTRNPNAKVRLG